MVKIDPELAQLCNVYRDVIEVPSTGSVYRVVSSDAPLKEGLNPTLVIFDEVHVQPDDKLWNVMEMAFGARPEPLMVGITTAGVMTDRLGNPSVCYKMYEHGIDVAEGKKADPTFFFSWWEPVDGGRADHRDPKVWAEANPGLGDVVATEDFESTITRVPESEFRTKRTNVFVAASQTWLPYGAWDAVGIPGASIAAGQTVVLGFDGSYNNDSTVIVAATVGHRPLVQTLRAWEKPSDALPDWTVPVEEVEGELRKACRKWRVSELVCDTARWAKTFQTLKADGLPVVEYPQSPERMIPATQRFYEAVMNGMIAHGEDPVLTKHLSNCVLKISERGSRIVKQTRGSLAKIDAAIAAVMAYDRAAGPPTVAAGWMGAWRAESATNAVEAEPVEEAPTIEQISDPRAMLLGTHDLPPSPRDCQHRWHPLDHVCVYCQIPRCRNCGRAVHQGGC